MPKKGWNDPFWDGVSFTGGVIFMLVILALVGQCAGADIPVLSVPVNTARGVR